MDKKSWTQDRDLGAPHPIRKRPWGTMFQTEPWRLRAPSFAKAVVLSQCACVRSRSAAHLCVFGLFAVAATMLLENKVRFAALRRLHRHAESNTARVRNKVEQPNPLLAKNRKMIQVFGLVSGPQCGLEIGSIRAKRTEWLPRF